MTTGNRSTNKRSWAWQVRCIHPDSTRKRSFAALLQKTGLVSRCQPVTPQPLRLSPFSQVYRVSEGLPWLNRDIGQPCIQALFMLFLLFMTKALLYRRLFVLFMS